MYFKKLEIVKHAIRGMMIKDLDEKKQLVELLAIAVYADHITREEEIRAAEEIIEAVFFEDYKYLCDELSLILEDFNKNLHSYEEKKEKMVHFIKSNNRLDLAKVLVDIFESDHDIARGEQKMIDQLHNLIKKG